MSTPTKRGPKKWPKVAARKCYGDPNTVFDKWAFTLYPGRKPAFRPRAWHVPVFILPADAESCDAMAERMARAMGNADANDRCSYFEMAEAALRSIGLVATKGKK